VCWAVQAWGRIDLLVHRAGFLRDKSVAKMDARDFRDNLEVHVMGPSFRRSHAARPHMVEQHWGCIVFNTSSAALFGHFGRTNYGAAKLAVVGMVRTMALAGAPRHIQVNSISPAARSRLTATAIPDEVLGMLTPEAVVPALLVLVCEQAPTNTAPCAGAGTFDVAQMMMTPGIYWGHGGDVPQALLAPASAEAQVTNEVWMAMAPR
jgi:NAD(P)-dependent dehydrogenase (short-subunit alcohol dehydrogenase family)